MDQLCIVTTGGTIDKIYFDDKSDFQVGEPQIGRILEELGVAFRYNVIPIIRKDSLHITAEDRELLRATIAAQDAKHVLITHG
ncbi:MAG: asparaginase domain-containing protein, partial [Lysobacter sp.]